MELREILQGKQKKKGIVDSARGFSVAGCLSYSPQKKNGRENWTAKDFNTESEERI